MRMGGGNDAIEAGSEDIGQETIISKRIPSDS